MTAQVAPLVETTRGISADAGAIENVHFGAVAVVNAKGDVLHCAGDPDYPTFTRSALKPLQALPLVESDGIKALGLDAADLALFCASHSGEPRHVERVAAILKTLALAETDLQCGCQVPIYYATTGKKPPADAVFTQLHHNCSGKHTGMLAWCRFNGVDHGNYLDLDHPLQQRIHQRLLEEMRLEEDQAPVGIDGCSAPNYQVPLSALARFYARIAISDATAEPALASIFEAMTGYPELVSGEGRPDLAYMSARAGDWISKAGADGVQVLASKTRGLGIALKIADGSPRALNTAMVGVLAALDMLDDEGRRLTHAWHRPEIRNYKKLAVGVQRSVVKLESS
jgi:L-asparaginase II